MRLLIPFIRTTKYSLETTACFELTDCITPLIRMNVRQAKELTKGGNFRKSTYLHLLRYTYMIALLGSISDT